MIRRYNNISLAIGIPGFILQIIGATVAVIGAKEEMPSLLGVLISLIGSGMLIIGLAYYAKAKDRHWAWCLFGLFSLMGILVLFLLADRAVTPAKPEEAGEFLLIISDKANAAFWLGILSLLLCVLFPLPIIFGAALWLGILSLLLCVFFPLAIIFGILGLKEVRAGKGILIGKARAITGIVLGLMGGFTLLGIVFFVVIK